VSLGEGCFPFSMAHERVGDQLCGKEGERVQLRFLLEVIECSCYVSWLG
jgi:hypothetical protein